MIAHATEIATSRTCLREREAKAMHILREAAAQFDRPVLLYSVGKDSSVLLPLASRAPAEVERRTS